jgi:hypothetical protein
MNKRIFSLLALAALIPGYACAQSETAAEAEEIPSYDVEIVIFKNLKVPKSKEFILPVSSPGKDEKIFDITSASSVAAARKLDYELLKEDGFRLTEIVARLEESPRYELLLHRAWRQPGLERGKSMPIWLRGGRVFGNEYTSIDDHIELLESIPQSGGKEPDGQQKHEFDEQTLEALELQMLEQQAQQLHPGLYVLEGKITVALSRYLHVYTDLVLRRPRLSMDQVANNPAQDRYLAAYAADTRILDNHRLKEHRRMRSRNLHYLDSPEFAILILITPYEAPEPVAGPTAEPAAEPAAVVSE